jgi:hypothetical protein
MLLHIIQKREFFMVKGKGLPQQAEVAQGVQGRLRPRIFLTFGTTGEVGRHPYAPATFTSRRNPWYSFLGAESTPGHMVPSVSTEKIPSDTTGNRSRGRRTIAQCNFFMESHKQYIWILIHFYIFIYFGSD